MSLRGSSIPIIPKHRRGISVRLDGSHVDPMSQATCRNFGKRECIGVCPRHRPEMYADLGGRHQDDDIGGGE